MQQLGISATIRPATASCLIRPERKSRKVRRKLQILHMTHVVMAELIYYIQHNNNAMRLSDRKKFYSQRLQQVGSCWSTVSIHPTRFKKHLLQRLGGEWQAFAKGCNVFFTSKATVGSLLSESISQDKSRSKGDRRGWSDFKKAILEIIKSISWFLHINLSYRASATLTTDSFGCSAWWLVQHSKWWGQGDHWL